MKRQNSIEEQVKTLEEAFVAEKQVILHFRKVNESMQGFLIRETPNSYFLVKAKLLTGKNDIELEGTQIVPKSDVFFVQVLGAEHAL